MSFGKNFFFNEEVFGMVGDEYGAKAVVKVLGDQLVRSGSLLSYWYVGTKGTVKNALP
jgi:hypothetical protein